MSDNNDVYPHDDRDVIQIASPPVDITTAANSIKRLVDDRSDDDRGVDGDRDDDGDRGGVAANAAAPPSAGSRDLAAMLMFDLDYVEAER
jgi:hypothetical protein